MYILTADGSFENFDMMGYVYATVWQMGPSTMLKKYGATRPDKTEHRFPVFDFRSSHFPF